MRSDWGGLDRAAHAASLRADFAADRDGPGALARLLYYYPAEGRREVHERIRQLMDEPGEANLWPVGQLIDTLDSFDWAELRSDLFALWQRAVTQERAFETLPQARKNPLAMGPAEAAVACSLRLVHKGHDEQIRAFAVEEIKRLHAQAASFSGAGSSAFDYQIDRYNDLLRRLDDRSENPPSQPSEPPVGPPPQGMSVRLSPIDLVHGRWNQLRLRFEVSGIDASQLAAARVVLTSARDDTDFDLAPRDRKTEFVHPAVGRTDDSAMTANPPPSVEVYLDRPPGLAHRLRSVRGYIDLVAPSFDANSVVRVERVAGTLGVPIRSPLLAAAHVTVTVFDAKSCNDAFNGSASNSGGPQDYGARPLFRDGPPKGAPADLFKAPEVTDVDIAFGIDDPDNRAVATELVAPDGLPLRYNHNGWYHSSGTQGRRLDLYRLSNPDSRAEATAIFHLVTEKSLVRVPFEFSDVPLPDRG